MSLSILPIPRESPTAKAEPRLTGAVKRTSYYRPELDVLRFGAFLMVFVHHCPLPASRPLLADVAGAGGYGVCIFFMLSAYLITELLMKESERTGSIHIKAFFVRRALRIWPLYGLAVVLGVLVGELVPAYHIPVSAFPFLLLIATNFFVAHAGWKLGVIIPLWSLSIEEQFYLVIPSVMKWGNRKALRFAACVCFPAAYLALIWLGRRHVAPQTGIWVNSFVQFQFFAAGTLLAIGLHTRMWRMRIWMRLLMLVAGLSGLVLVEGLFHLQKDTPVQPSHLCFGYLMVLTSCVCIFMATLNAPVRCPRSLTYLGRISFGLYVFHDFVLSAVFYPDASAARRSFVHHHSFAFAFLSLGVTMAVASASFHLFEKRVLRFKERFAFVKSGVEGASLPVVGQG